MQLSKSRFSANLVEVIGSPDPTDDGLPQRWLRREGQGQNRAGDTRQAGIVGGPAECTQVSRTEARRESNE
jgi:hypothetical protein